MNVETRASVVLLLAGPVRISVSGGAAGGTLVEIPPEQSVDRDTSSVTVVPPVAPVVISATTIAALIWAQGSRRQVPGSTLVMVMQR